MGRAIASTTENPEDFGAKILTIGRGWSCDLVVLDDTFTASRLHAQIAFYEDALYIKDLESTNGTSIERDGVRAELTPGEWYKLEEGDGVWLGPEVGYAYDYLLSHCK